MDTSFLKKSLVCRKVGAFDLDRERVKHYVPRAGDVAIFRVVELGKILRIQDQNGHRAHVFPGDHLMAAFGDRYATNQVEAYVPDFTSLDLHLAGAGGVVGEVHSQNARLKDIEPTRLRLIGYATQHGKVINTNFLGMPRHKFTGNFGPKKPEIVLSLGSSMDSGKTTIAGGLARGLMLSGNKVAYMKLTGTAFTKDCDFVRDCGAALTTDFSEAGFTSTYMCSHEEIMDIYETLMQEVILKHTFDYLIIEVADGLFQRENKVLLRDPAFKRTVDHVIFSGGDSLSALYGMHLLRELDLAPFALSGKFTMSPLLIREVKEITSLPVLTLDELMDSDVAQHLSAATQKMEYFSTQKSTSNAHKASETAA